MKRKIILTIKIILLSLVVLGLAFAGITGVKGYSLYKDTMDGVDLQNTFDHYRSQEGYVSLDQISPTFLDALVAVEDHRFYEHGGFDEVAFLRAVMRNLSEKSYAAGGSTITQQLSKNLFFSFEKTLERKIAELIVAKQIEDEFSKEDILELYVNIIYYGDSFEGIYDASWGYFKKDPIDLTVGESVVLAGLPQAPSLYALGEHKENGIKRAYAVIDALIERGYIQADQREQYIESVENIQVKVND